MEKRSLKIFSRVAFAAALTFIVACGQEQSRGVPIPNNPAGDGSTKPINSNPPSDPRLPAWVGKAVELALPTTCSGTSTTCFQGQYIGGLMEAFQTSIVSLVDTYFALELDSGTNNSARGVIHLAYEDAAGFVGADIPSFARVSTYVSNVLDMTFSDSLLTVRLIGNVSPADGSINPFNVHYRVRQSGETACQATYYSCYVNYGDGRGNIQSDACPMAPPSNNDITNCRNYMKTDGSQAAVKVLGTVPGSKLSQWIQ